jgi:signal peptidase complex subunit 1
VGYVFALESRDHATHVLLQAIAFIVGYILQDIRLALYIGLGGTALAFGVIVPPWPFYNGQPVKWLPVAGSEIASQGITVDGKIVA